MTVSAFRVLYPRFDNLTAALDLRHGRDFFRAYLILQAHLEKFLQMFFFHMLGQVPDFDLFQALLAIYYFFRAFPLMGFHIFMCKFAIALFTFNFYRTDDPPGKHRRLNLHFLTTIRTIRMVFRSKIARTSLAHDLATAKGLHGIARHFRTDQTDKIGVDLLGLHIVKDFNIIPMLQSMVIQQQNIKLAFDLFFKMSAQKIIIFDTSKQELGNPGSNLKKFAKKYKEQHKIGLNKDAIDFQKIKKANLFVLASPKENFTPEEISALIKYVESGGSLMILCNEGGDQKNNSNLNKVTSKFGIKINNDCVVRTSFYKYFHPKEAYVQSGILNQEVTRVINGYAKEPKAKNNAFMMGARDDEEEEYQKEAKRKGADFVYVKGATLTVNVPSFGILTSGPLTYPSNRPITAIHEHKSGGKILVSGSLEMFLDDYFESEENHKIMDFFIKFLLTNEVQFQFTKEDGEPVEYNHVPDIAEIADNLKSCFHQGDELPRDFTSMFETNLFKYDFDFVPETLNLFKSMEVKHEQLTLIVPQFEVPLLGLAPGVFPPVLSQLPNPPLQLFDLDDEFSQQKVRLAQLTNKCTNKDLQYFVREAGDILGISDKIKNRGNPKAIIRYILEQIISFKKMN